MRRQTTVDSPLGRSLVFFSAGTRFVALHTDTAAVAVFTDFKTTESEVAQPLLFLFAFAFAFFCRRLHFVLILIFICILIFHSVFH